MNTNKKSYLIKCKDSEQILYREATVGKINNLIYSDKNYLFGDKGISDIVRMVREYTTFETNKEMSLIEKDKLNTLINKNEDKMRFSGIFKGYNKTEILSGIMHSKYKYTYCLETDELKPIFIPEFTLQRFFIEEAFGFSTIHEYIDEIELQEFDYSKKIKLYREYETIENFERILKEEHCGTTIYKFFIEPNSKRIIVAKNQSSTFGDVLWECAYSILKNEDMNSEEQSIYEDFMKKYNNDEVPYYYCPNDDIVDDDMPF